MLIGSPRGAFTRVPPRLPLLTLVLLALAAGCGSEPEQERATDLPPDELYNRIEAARELRSDAPAVPARLGALLPRDVPAEFQAGPSCRLSRGNTLLLVAGASGAVASIDGRPARLRIGGPVGPTGGYFVAPGVTVSVGRQVPAPGSAPAAGGPATASIGNGADAALQRVEGQWRCSSPGMAG